MTAIDLQGILASIDAGDRTALYALADWCEEHDKPDISGTVQAIIRNGWWPVGLDGDFRWYDDLWPASGNPNQRLPEALMVGLERPIASPGTRTAEYPRISDAIFDLMNSIGRTQYGQ